mgnify:CR=1 FL=1
MNTQAIIARDDANVLHTYARSPIALVEGRGERIEPLRPLPDTGAVICMPFFSCSTPELFARIDSRTSPCRVPVL